MAIRKPTPEDLKRLAEANHFELAEDELEGYQLMISALFDSYDVLDQMPETKEPLKYPDRDSGMRPTLEMDPYNAILRQCRLPGASGGKLNGKRIGLKNNINVAGMPMTCASKVLEGYIPETDATIVTRLLDAGGDVVALMNLDNFAYSGAGDTSSFGPTLNPHNTDHLAGGSSGGSAAALYYDYIDMTIGGDQGGSIRIPASFCGVVGHKPTHGLVPYTGIVGIDNTFDHTGPMTRTVADAALMLEVLAGKDPLDPRQGEVPVQAYTESLGLGAGGIRIGVLQEGFGLPESEADVDAGVQKALGILGELGAQQELVSVPFHQRSAGIVWSLISEGGTAALRSNGLGHGWAGVYNVGLADAMGKGLKAQSKDLSPQAKLVLLVGSYMTDQYNGRMYAKAQNARRDLRKAYDNLLERYDVLAMPTTPMKAHRNDANSDSGAILTHGWDMTSNTAPFNMTGHPAISIPCGKSNGLPIGLMLVGKHFDDAMVLRVANAFEQHTNWESL
jgi:amidase